MGNLKGSLPGIFFALSVISIAIYGIIKLPISAKNKASEKIALDAMNICEALGINGENQIRDSSYFIPSNDSIPFAPPNPKKELHLKVLSKVLQMLSDGFPKGIPSRSDSLEIDSLSK